MATLNRGTAMTDEDLKAMKEAIRQATERALETPESARRFIERISAPPANQQGDAD
ncbi:hypothetical protein [Azospirillum sp. TSO5]|uniref:hypothetical protein n=1 Tax=Azospirillum sp. TSO5 TaxID=716760 RepID=UPI001304A63F|nr:hypothetical protein [Azospirillum sp. TSO5]